MMKSKPEPNQPLLDSIKQWYASHPLISDELGFVSAFSMILLTALVCIGAIVGLGIVRDQVTQEFGDIAVALDNVDQSFSVEVNVDGMICLEMEYQDNPATLQDLADTPPACLNLTTPPTGENGSPTPPSGVFP